MKATKEFTIRDGEIAEKFEKGQDVPSEYVETFNLKEKKLVSGAKKKPKPEEPSE